MCYQDLTAGNVVRTDEACFGDVMVAVPLPMASVSYNNKWQANAGM